MTEDEADEYAAWKTGRELSVIRAGVRMQKEQTSLESQLNTIAKKLGLRIRVSYDAYNFGWCVDAGLASTPRSTYTFDEDFLVTCEPKHLIDLFIQAMSDLQYKVFDDAAKRMSELDTRGRVYVLDKADRDTLYEMLRDAEDRLHTRFVYAEEGQNLAYEKSKRYQALFGKLIR